MKLAIVVEYNKSMGWVDLSDQYLASFSAHEND